jgi:flagellar assembly factor FliW
LQYMAPMARIQTKCFGEVDYSPESVFEFPQGMPGFEAEHAFLFMNQPATYPLMFMQSLSRVDLCFILLPVLAADPQYKLCVSDEDLATLCLPAGKQPRIGKDILCAAMVCTGNAERPDPTVNLLAPIVVNLKQQIGIQAIQTPSRYSYRHPLIPQDLTSQDLTSQEPISQEQEEEAAPCL